MSEDNKNINKRGSEPAAFEEEPLIKITRREIALEIADERNARRLRKRLLPRALLVGVIAGLIATVFRYSLHWLGEWRTQWIEESSQAGNWTVLMPVMLASMGAGLSVWLVRTWSPAAAGSGIPQLKGVLLHLRRMNWLSLILVKFVGGLLAMGSGLALGREGPMVQMGGATGKMVGRLLGMTKAERFILIAAGAGAGLSAAFNAPLAGLIFVLEEISRAFTPVVFFAGLLATVAADTVSRSLLGQEPVLQTQLADIPSLAVFPVFLLVGVAAGVLGVAFNRSLAGSLKIFDRTKHWPVWLMALMVGTCVGVIGWFFPQLLGSGHHVTMQALAGQLAVGSLAFFFVLRFFMTMVSYGCGAPGGIFAPVLVLGALLGMGVGELAQEYYPVAIENSGVFAVVAMAAFFTSVVRAPLTAIILILEMTNSYSLMLPLLGACLTAYMVAEGMNDRPIYEVLMERDLKQQRERVKEAEQELAEVT
ncbi:MAG: H(+)/Cl(-) exchange transporter ClcA [Verrucomicrobiales bacterium]|nr:H(+)/Cl(-) exchange transporter ClcA [Verrucomicrobiales bacterium]